MDRASRELIRSLARSYGYWIAEASVEGSRCKQGIDDLARWTKAGALRVATPYDAKRELFFVVYHAKNAARSAARAVSVFDHIKEVLGVK